MQNRGMVESPSPVLLAKVHLRTKGTTIFFPGTE